MSFITRSHARDIDKRRVQDAAECRLLHCHINILIMSNKLSCIIDTRSDDLSGCVLYATKYSR